MSELEEFILRLKTYNYKDCEELLKGYAKQIRADAIDEIKGVISESEKMMWCAEWLKNGDVKETIGKVKEDYYSMAEAITIEREKAYNEGLKQGKADTIEKVKTMFKDKYIRRFPYGKTYGYPVEALWALNDIDKVTEML